MGSKVYLHILRKSEKPKTKVFDSWEHLVDKTEQIGRGLDITSSKMLMNNSGLNEVRRVFRKKANLVSEEDIWLFHRIGRGKHLDQDDVTFCGCTVYETDYPIHGVAIVEGYELKDDATLKKLLEKSSVITQFIADEEK